MSWNPDIYNKFKNERYQPFYDLLAMVDKRPGIAVIDLGCGTGELTQKLADALPGSMVTGLDNSPEMLQKAQSFASGSIRFEEAPIESFIQRKEQYDLVFSNAAIQWVEGHEQLIPSLIARLKKNGQLAIQMPANEGSFTHRTLRDLSAIEPFSSQLKASVSPTPVLDISRYAEIFFENGGREITVIEKIYPHVLQDARAVFDWVSGTAILRYTSRLPEALKERFTSTYREKILHHYPENEPVFYPYRRILLSAIF